MTLEELKAEAEKLGYTLVKKNPYVALLPCSCGEKHSIRWGGAMYYCCKCGLVGKPSRYKYQARKNWNTAVKGETDDE